MFLGPEILAAHAALILASADISCKVTVAPAVSIKVITDDIDYDYSHTAADLTSVKTDTVSPFPKGSDSVTGGLREDHPEIKSEMKWDISYDQTGNACMFYKTIDVTIHLRPRIYLAQEFNVDGCRDAVLGHERKHIQVDHEVMNKYANLVGVALKETVDRVGAIGPFNIKDKDSEKEQASHYIRQTLGEYEKALSAELHTRQQAVDSLAEYQRIGTFCRGVRATR